MRIRWWPGLMICFQAATAMSTAQSTRTVDERRGPAAATAVGASVRPARASDVLVLLERQSRAAGSAGMSIVSIATDGFTLNGDHYFRREFVAGPPAGKPPFRSTKSSTSSPLRTHAAP